MLFSEQFGHFLRQDQGTAVVAAQNLIDPEAAVAPEEGDASPDRALEGIN